MLFIIVTKSLLETYANGVDPDKMPQIMASDKGLHYLPAGVSMQNTIKIKLKKCRSLHYLFAGISMQNTIKIKKILKLDMDAFK